MNIADQEVDVRGALLKGLSDLATGIIKGSVATGVIGGVIWSLSAPHIEEYLQNREDRTVEAISVRTAQQLEPLKAAIALLQVETRPVLQFNGAPILMDPPSKVHRPGGVVRIGYSLRRNEACATRLVIRFISGELSRMDTSLTYSVEATQAPVSSSFLFFVADLRLPSQMQDGFYSYAPAADLTGCKTSEERIEVPPSPLFEVRND